MVSVAGLDQLIHVRPVGVEPLGLAVRRVGASHIGALVVGEAEPAQGGEDLVLAARHQPVLVRVLNAEHNLPASLPGPGEIEQRLIGGAHVGITGG